MPKSQKCSIFTLNLKILIWKQSLADRIIHLCDMKFSQGEFRITKDYEDRLRNRMSLFKEKTKNKKTLVHTFVTTYGVADGKYSNIVHSEVTLDGLFMP